MDQRRRTMLAVLTVAGLLVIVLGANALGSWQLTPRFNLPFEPRGGTPPPMTPPAQSGPMMPSGALPPGHGPMVSADTLRTIFRVIVGVVVLAVVIFIAGILWRMRPTGRHEGELSGTASPVADLRESARRAVQQARHSLRHHRKTGNIAESIVAAWAALENVAAETGHRRRPEQTASDFTAALLTELAGADDEIAELLGLYHRARYGTDNVIGGLSATDADRADELLDALADRLESELVAAADEDDSR